MPKNLPRKHLIAYIDFLGTKEHIKKDSTNEYFLFLLDLYKNLFNDIKKRNSDEYRYLKEIKVRSFSDNILFATSMNLTHKWQLSYALGDFIRIAGNIQAIALMNGFLVRGGITIGDIFINDNFVYGKGLLDVLDLEEKVAHYPRIVIHESIEKECPEYFKANYNIISDFDGLKYINFYHYCVGQGRELEICTEQLERMKQEKSCTSYNVVSKLNWTIMQHNNFLKNIYANKESIPLILPAKVLEK